VAFLRIPHQTLPSAAGLLAADINTAVMGQVDAAQAAAKPRCTFYLAKKRRHCRFEAKAGYPFCGNHLPAQCGLGKRVPCPGNPNHDVLENELQAHLKRCPDALLAAQHKREPFFKEDVNGGEGPDVPLPLSGEERLATRRAALAVQRGRQGLTELIRKVMSAWSATCESAAPLERVCCPPACQPYMVPDSLRPFSIKHAQQQASIVGNMGAEGLLRQLPAATIVEFGAGRGYLTSMIADSTPAQRLVLLDRTSFRFKADRSLRKGADISLTRLRCDIKDFDPAGAPPLAGSTPAPWLAVGKHLCGAATDFTLRCCRRYARAAPDDVRCATPGAAAMPCVGVTIATCCHHRCTWRHYVAKSFCTSHGIGPEDFEIMSWMTGWALCGHEAPAGCGEGGAEAPDADRGGSKRPTSASPDPPCSEPAQVGGRRSAEAVGAGLAQECCPASAAAAEAETSGGMDAGVKQSAVPGWWLEREERIRIGQACKQLIDRGRMLWLQAQGFQSKLVKYIPAEVSGENTLLIAAPVSAQPATTDCPAGADLS